jgi:hypothetical protein
MVNVTLSYNPYLVRTSISWEDHHIDNNSELNIPFGVRLQEWIEQLPSRLSKETNDKVHLKFIGTKTDYEDVKAAFKNSDVPYELEFEEKYDVDEAEKLINGTQVSQVNQAASSEISRRSNASFTALIL